MNGATGQSKVSAIKRLYIKAAAPDRLGIGMLRTGLVIVLVWTGALKFASYQADGLVPLVANSPFMSFLYRYPAPEYREHMNKEGQVAVKDCIMLGAAILTMAELRRHMFGVAPNQTSLGKSRTEFPISDPILLVLLGDYK